MRRFPILLSVLFAGFGVVFLAYQQALELDFSIVGFGLASLFGAYALAALVAFSVAGNWPSPQDRVCARLLAAGLVLVLTVFALLYLWAFIANTLWGDTLDYEMMLAFAPQLGTVFGVGLLSPGEQALVQASVAAGVIVFLVLVVWFSRSLAASAVMWARQWLGRRPGRRPAMLPLWSAAMLAAAVAAGVWIEKESPLAGEPLTSFLGITGATSPLLLDETRVAALAEDAASLAAYPVGIPFEKKNVILIFADSLRADHKGVYGYARPTTPFLSSLQAKGDLHRVEMALSTCSDSFCGIASTLASKPLHEISIGSLKLNTILRREGYRIHFYLSGDHRTWRFLQDFYGADIDDLHEFSPYDTDIRDDRNIIGALGDLPPDDANPHFFYFFLMSSHILGTRIPEYERFQPSNVTLGGSDGVLKLTRKRESPISDALRTALTNRHDNGTLQADDMIRQIVQLLEDRGYMEDSLVVILGDHGEGLGEHGNILHSLLLYQEHIHIPLLVWDKEPERYRNGVFATQIDVAPTVLDRLGLPVPASWRGRSMLDPPAERVTLHQTRRGARSCAAVVRHPGADPALHPMKYIRCGADPASKIEEVFDLADDPQERTNLLGTIDKDSLAFFRDAVRARFEPLDVH